MTDDYDEEAIMATTSKGVMWLEFLINKKSSIWEFSSEMADDEDQFDDFMSKLSEYTELVETLGFTHSPRLFMHDAKRLFGIMAVCDILKIVKLEYCRLTDFDVHYIVEFLEESASCVGLSLSNNYFSADGIQKVCKGLAFNDQILDFRIANNPIGNAGVKFIGDMLRVNTIMETLDINHTGFDAAGETEMLNGLSQNRTVRTINYDHITTKNPKVTDRLGQNNLLWREKFLKDLKDEQTGKWNRSKLMFIGQGRAGKTSTVSRLLNRGFDDKQDSTVGASVSQTQTSTTKEQKWKTVNENDPEFLGKGMVAGNAGKVIAARKILNHGKDSKEKKNKKKKLDRLKKEKAKRDKNQQQISDEVKGNNELLFAQMEARRKADEELAKRQQAADDLFLAQELQRQEMENLRGRGDGDDMVMDEETMRQMMLENEEREKREKEAEKEAEAAKMYAEAVFKAARETRDSITFSLWDYGGQTVFYALHHLFLTKYGIYVLCCDMREILHRPEVAKQYLLFWLNSVKLHAPTAPVLLVGTYMDAIESKENLDDVNTFVVDTFQEKFKQLTSMHPHYSFYPVDNKNNKGVDELRFDIERISRKQEFVTADVSLRWLYCLDKMLLERTEEGETPAWLSLSRVRDVALRVNMTSQDELEKMLGLFHELGVIVRLTNTEQLRNIITLDPQWLIDGLCQVIRDDNLHNNFDMQELDKAGLRSDVDLLYKKALATQDVMAYLWKGEKWKNHQNFLLDLMKYMVLISDWDFRNEKMYIIPSLLTPRFEEIDLFKHPLETKHDETKNRVVDVTDVMDKKKNGKNGKKTEKKEKKTEKKKSVSDKKPVEKKPEDKEGKDKEEEEEEKKPEIREEETVTDYAVFDFSKLFLPVGVFQRLVCLCVSYSTTVGDGNGKKATEPELYQVWAKIWMGNDLIIYLEQRGDEIWMSVEDPATAPTCFKAINSMLGKLNNELMGSGLHWETSVKKVRRNVKQEEGKSPIVKEIFEIDLPVSKAEKKGVLPWFNKSEKAAPTEDILNLDKFVDAF